MKINFQELLYGETSSFSFQKNNQMNNTFDFDSISIEDSPYVLNAKTATTIKSNKNQQSILLGNKVNNIQETMDDLLSSSMSQIPNKNNKINTSFQDSSVFQSVGDNNFLVSTNYKGRYADLKCLRIKEELLSSIQRKEKRPTKNNVHNKLYTQNIHNIKQRKYQELILKNLQKETYQQGFAKVTSQNVNKKKNLSGRPNIGQELYSQHRKNKIHNQLRSRYIRSQMTKQCTFHPTIRDKPQYLKKYRPLMERYDEEITKKKEQQEFMAYHKDIDFQDTNMEMFKPVLRKTAISAKSRVFDFMNKSAQQIKIDSERPSFQRNSSTSNFSQGLNKSLEIMRKREQSYLQRLTNKLFMNRETIIINSDTISRIQESQFQILYPFIYGIQKQGKQLHRDEFRKMFQQFFKSLTVDKKHTLSFIYRNSKYFDGCCSEQFKVNPEMIHKPRIGHKSKRIGDNYLSKLQKFV